MYQSICNRFEKRWFGRLILPGAFAVPAVSGVGLMACGHAVVGLAVFVGGPAGWAGSAGAEYLLRRRFFDERPGITAGSRQLQRAQVKGYVLGFAGAVAAITGVYKPAPEVPHAQAAISGNQAARP